MPIPTLNLLVISQAVEARDVNQGSRTQKLSQLRYCYQQMTVFAGHTPMKCRSISNYCGVVSECMYNGLELTIGDHSLCL